LPGIGEPRRGTSAWARAGLPLGGLVAIALFGLFGEPALDLSLVGPTPLETVALDPGAAPAALAPRERSAPAPPPVADRVEILRRGQTLSSVLAGVGIAGEAAHQAALASARYVDLRQLRPGARFEIFADAAGAVERIDLALDGRGELSLARTGQVWSPSWRPYQRETRVRSVAGALAGALESSIERAGAPGDLAYALGEVLQWDLDFNRDLQPGDRFGVLFEEVWIEGRYHGLGNVLAATYDRAAGKRLEVFRYVDGYYDAEGRPLEKAFLRSPMPYSRVTSRFSKRRFHPVLGVFRPHHGVDYGAPVGTPVRATAAGTVTFAGWDGGGGKTVKIRHPNDFLTGYLHLSKFAAGVRPGAAIAQGDVIGYVGATGLATGPHLDYRVQHRGKWIDPLSLAAVPAEPLSRLELVAFASARDAMRADLERGAGDPREPAFQQAAAGAAASAPAAVAARR
jgi:murein DD-endopeptidase MepM/ murein hydrolase activator NlpD